MPRGTATRRTARTRTSRAASRTSRSDTISTVRVEVGQLPGVICTVVLDGGRKVSDALGAAKLTGVEGEVRVNGRKVEGDPELRNGDKVYVLKKLRGN